MSKKLLELRKWKIVKLEKVIRKPIRNLGNKKMAEKQLNL